MEIEIKFVIPDDTTCKRLQETDQLAGFLLSSGHLQHIHDVYLDTAQRDILKAGFACRKREQDSRFIITLKQLARAEQNIHRRQEFEIAIPSAALPPAQWPDSPARSAILQFTQQAPLIPLCTVIQRRFVRLMRSPHNRLVAELSIGEVRILAADAAQAYYELEVELRAEGTEYDLEKIQKCLRHEWVLKPESFSKFERALTLTTNSMETTSRKNASVIRLSAADDADAKRSSVSDQHACPPHKERKRTVSARNAAPALNRESAMPAVQRPPHSPSPKRPGLTVNDTMAEAARKTLYFHLKRMANHEQGTRLGEDIEELHDMRVATRRMRAAISVFGEYMDMKKIKPFAKNLRRVGGVLGSVRDLDVFQQKAHAYIDTLPPRRRDEMEPLLTVLTEQHQTAREQMIGFMDSPKYARFKRRFEKFLKKPGAAELPVLTSKDEPAPRYIRHVLPLVVYQRLATVRAYEALIHDTNISLKQLHRLRIALKGLRYSLEFFREILHPDTERLIDEIKTLQDHLGNIQDAVVTCNTVRNFLTWGTWKRGDPAEEITQLRPVIAPGVVTYLSVRQTELQNLVETFPAAWIRMQQAGFFKNVATVLHRI
jgi:CHAD domain-containing protein